MSDDIHSCSPYCNRPACVQEQRDKMRDAMAIDDVKMPEPEYFLSPSGRVSAKSSSLVPLQADFYTAAQMREYADAKCAELRRRVAEIEADARRFVWQVEEWCQPKCETNMKVLDAYRTGDINAIRAAIDDAIGAEGGE